MAIGVAAALLAPAGADAAVTLVDRDSEVHANSAVQNAGGGTTGGPDEVEFFGPGSFNDSVSSDSNGSGQNINGDPISASGHGEADQDSSVNVGSNGLVVNASGNVGATAAASGTNPFGGGPSGHGLGLSDLHVTFEIDEEMSYSLQGSRLFTTYGDNEIELDPQNGDPPVFFTDSGAGSISQTGTLQPGGYRLTVSIEALAEKNNTTGTNETPDAGSFNVGLTVSPTSSSCAADPAADTDDDALPDCWESDGLDIDGDDAVDLDLPAMGADPMHKDIFLELDSMPGRVPSPTAIDRVVASFAAAPVANPDGTDGIRLHVDSGPASVMNPVTGATWGTLSDADALGFQNVLGTFEPGGNYNWSAFDTVKAANFSSDREPAFHYVVAANQYGEASNTSSGISRGIGASDLLVTLGAFPTPGGTISQQAGTLMHELGHNLALRHGGDDDLNYKPNYLSIMNYSFQMGGLLRADGARVLDYSRLAIGLDESALDESTGFGYSAGSDPAQFMTMVGCPNNSAPIGDPGTLFVEPLLAGPVDWDCDGATGGVVAADVNGDGLILAFNSFLDWPNLAFGGGSVGDAAGASLPETTEMIEPQADELLENEHVLEEAVGGGGEGAPSTPSPDPGSSDTTSPDTAITSGPKKKEKNGSASFSFTSTEPGSSFECRLDAGAFDPCTTPEDIKVKKGKHTFEVRATDAAGNTDPSPATQSWKVKKKRKK